MVESFSLVTGPADEPVTLDEMKDHARIDDTNSDAEILDLIITAREHLERTYCRMLMAQTWDYNLDRFPTEIRICRAPISSITSVTYTDSDGVSQTLATANYQTDLTLEPARIKPAYGLTWPTTRGVYNAVTVRFVGGYASANDVPNNLKHAVMQLVSHWNENKEIVQIGASVSSPLPFTTRALMAPYEIWPLTQ